MTLERVIGYGGLFLVGIHAIPFSDTFVTIASIILGVVFIFCATYLKWKHTIHAYMHSHKGTMSLPHFFDRLTHDARQYGDKKK